MQSVVTLVCNPREPDLDSGIVAEVRDALSEQSATVGPADWLSDIACDLPFDGIDCQTAFSASRLRLQGWPIDIIAQPAQGRRKKLLIADMDSTIVTGETLDELAEFAGLKDRISRITERAMNGEIRFRDALNERVGLLKGLPADTLEKTMKLVELTPGARQLVRTMGANGAYCALVSGGFDFFTTRIARSIGFHHNQGNVLEIKNDCLTGRVLDPIVTKDTKLEVLDRLAAERGLDRAETLAVGDGANDLPMLMAAGLGIAIRAKPIVASTARHRVDHADLTALLYAQGYRDSEIIDENHL